MKILFAIIAVLCIASCEDSPRVSKHQKNKATTIVHDTPAHPSDSISTTYLKSTRAYLKTHKVYNSYVIFLVNMNRSSRYFRFFVVKVSTGKILEKGLVAQGINTKNDESGQLVFSNQVQSECSSLGKYKIGEKYNGRFGAAYKLYGLDKTNSNAYKRAVVLHKYETVPDSEQDEEICFSRGCPMVSPGFFTIIEKIIDTSARPILLDIVYERCQDRLGNPQSQKK